MKRALRCWLISMIMILSFFCVNVYAEEDGAVSDDYEAAVTEQMETREEDPDAADPAAETVVPDTAAPAMEDDSKEAAPEAASQEADSKSAHEHVYEAKVTKQPTCEEKGETAYTCSCGDSYTEEIAATGHKWGEVSYTWAKDCSTVTAKRVCANDDSHVQEETVSVTAKITKAATCTEAGIKTWTTATFSNAAFEVQQKTAAIAAKGHTYKNTVTAPTCEEKGFTTHTCTECGNSYTDSFVDAKGHSWGDWVVVKKATNEKEGSKKRTCKNDNTHVETQVIPAKYPLLGSARRDENGTYSGGKPGDQTGHEIETERWYLHEKGWVVIRAKNEKAREMVATAMEAICASEYIGYNQSDRYSIFDKGKALKYDYDMLTTACNADCSTAVGACVRYAGIEVTPFETDTARIILGETGKFNILTDTKYTNSPYYLLRGDILVTKVKGHTMVVLENGAKAAAAANSGLAITQQPESQARKVGEKVNLSVTAAGSGLEYRWYRRTSSKGAWTLLTDSKGKSTYSFTMASRHNGYQYCCVIIDAAGKRVSSDIAKVTLGSGKVTSAALKITSQPESLTVKKGSKATFSVAASGAVSYQWYFKSSSRASWKKVTAAGGNTASYSPKTDARHNGYRYRCKVTGASDSVYSDTVKLTVVTARPKIKTQPKNKTVTAGNTVTFKIKVSGRALTYQWYYRNGASDSWKMVEAGTEASYKFTTAKKQNGYQFRCVVRNLMGSRTSKAVKLTVK